MQAEFSAPFLTFNLAARSWAVLPRVESIVDELLKMFCASALELTTMIGGGWQTVDVELISQSVPDVPNVTGRSAAAMSGCALEKPMLQGSLSWSLSSSQLLG